MNSWSEWIKYCKGLVLLGANLWQVGHFIYLFFSLFFFFFFLTCLLEYNCFTMVC